MDGTVRAPFTGDLDLDAVRTREDLAALLRAVHARADAPALRTLERRTGGRVSKSTIGDVLAGNRFPRRAGLAALLDALGLAEQEHEPWDHAWQRLAEVEQTRAAGEAGELHRLRAENEQLWAENERLREQVEQLTIQPATSEQTRTAQEVVASLDPDEIVEALKALDPEAGSITKPVKERWRRNSVPD
ncbi:hypothetical protein [Microtetraspora sp. NBRC 13810]|uniref:hypothetical protein n=1 Tax=Microtetraspora sp. NBRC 13810 TaxID=3030990 RepID=UPI002554908D|nr:hypothetical protein [Microtetraspora sp. NBRC 13810]